MNYYVDTSKKSKKHHKGGTSFMESKLIQPTDTLPAIIKNTHINVSLQGWPAAITVIALCCAGVAVYAIKAATQSKTSTA